MINILLIAYLLTNANSFRMTMYNKLPNNWDNLKKSMKDNARDWFVNRAIQKGIPWNELHKKYQSVHDELENFRIKKENVELEYPSYYLKSFHGYEDGNMNWKAAEEAESATLSIAAGYWDKSDPYISQDWMRYNISENVNNYFKSIHGNKYYFPKNALDIGCSTGISTEYLKKSVGSNCEIHGVDLSPYFIGVAEYINKKKGFQINYQHENAEFLSYKNNTFDFIISNFVFHELPEDAANNIVHEMYRVLSPDGIVAIVDIDPIYLDGLLKGNIFRKWAFEVTEPHIYNYYKRDIVNTLNRAGFTNITKKRNDPLNSIWLGTKNKFHLKNNGCKKEREYKKFELSGNSMFYP